MKIVPGILLALLALIVLAAMPAVSCCAVRQYRIANSLRIGSPNGAQRR